MRHVQVHGPTSVAILRIYLNRHTSAGLSAQPPSAGQSNQHLVLKKCFILINT